MGTKTNRHDLGTFKSFWPYWRRGHNKDSIKRESRKVLFRRGGGGVQKVSDLVFPHFVKLKYLIWIIITSMNKIYQHKVITLIPVRLTVYLHR